MGGRDRRALRAGRRSIGSTGPTRRRTCSASSSSTPARSCPLNDAKRPNSYWAATDPSRRRPGRGPHLHLLRATRRTPGRRTTGRTRPRCAAILDGLFRGCMRGRTMYVVPFSMGPLGSPALLHRRRDHRLALRRGEHAHDDPRRSGRARRARRRRRVRALRALARRAARGRRGGLVVAVQPRREVDRPLPRDARDLVVRLRATAATRCSARSASRCASRR